MTVKEFIDKINEMKEFEPDILDRLLAIDAKCYRYDSQYGDLVTTNIQAEAESIEYLNMTTGEKCIILTGWETYL